MGTKKGTKRKDLVPQVEPGDNARFLRFSLGIYNMGVIDISDPVQVQQRIEDYFRFCIENDMKVGQEGLCLALGITRDTWLTWAKGKYRGETHSGIVKRANQILRAMWEQYMNSGKINPVAGIFLAKNHFGYQDKTEIEVTPRNPITDGLPNSEQIAEKYKALPEDGDVIEMPD